MEHVHRFKLGESDPARSAQEISKGLTELINTADSPDWEEYNRFAGCERNISIIEEEFHKR